MRNLTEQDTDRLVELSSDMFAAVVKLTSDTPESLATAREEFRQLSDLEGVSDEQLADREFWRGLVHGFIKRALEMLEAKSDIVRFAQTHMDILAYAIQLRDRAETERPAVREEAYAEFMKVVAYIQSGRTEEENEKPMTAEQQVEFFSAICYRAAEIANAQEIP